MANSRANKKPPFFTGRNWREFLTVFLTLIYYNTYFHICNKNKSGLYFKKGDWLYKSNLSWASQLGN